MTGCTNQSFAMESCATKIAIPARSVKRFLKQNRNRWRKTMTDRDCKSCVNNTPGGCSAWGCEYINRDEAIRAWKEQHKDERVQK